jgi:hypothetical protein
MVSIHPVPAVARVDLATSHPVGLLTAVEGAEELADRLARAGSSLGQR